jgi:hypothetical protein
LTGSEGSRGLILPDFKTIGTWKWQDCVWLYYVFFYTIFLAYIHHNGNVSLQKVSSPVSDNHATWTFTVTKFIWGGHIDDTHLPPSNSWTHLTQNRLAVEWCRHVPPKSGASISCHTVYSAVDHQVKKPAL